MLPEKIAVVDDDPRIHQSLKLALGQYEVISFYNGQDALDYFRKPHDVTLVLLDVFMSGQDGIAVLGELKRCDEDLSVVIMTGYGTKDIAIEALRLHADDFIEKPFDLEELKDKVGGILKKKSISQGTAAYQETKIERMKRLIDRSCAQVSLKDVSRELCLCPKYVSRVFREKTKKNFRTYKLNHKMKIAKTLLKGSALSVNQIAEKLGYQNAESFMKTFKKIMECTPTQFRVRGRQVREHESAAGLK